MRSTSWEPSRGVAGVVERFLTPRMFRKFYSQELDRIERWAIDRDAVRA